MKIDDERLAVCQWTDEDMYLHFESFVEEKGFKADFIDIRREGSRVLGLVQGTEIEEHSYVDCVMSAAVSAGEVAVYNRIAHMLCVRPDAIRLVLDLDDPVKEAVLSSEEFLARIKKAVDFCDSLDAMPESRKIETDG